MPLLLLAVVLASDAWVMWDASRRHQRHDDVEASVGPITMDRPEHWLIACIVIWVIAFPMYLVARRRS